MYAKVNKQVMTLIEETATSEMTVVNLWLPAAVVNRFSLTPPILSLFNNYASFSSIAWQPQSVINPPIRTFTLPTGVLVYALCLILCCVSKLRLSLAAAYFMSWFIIRIHYW